MSQSLVEDRGYRYVEAGGSAGASRSRVEERADRAGAWSEEKGIDVFGDDGVMPGMGDSGPHCGEYYPEKVCTGCGGPDFAPHRCGNRSCPDCWGMWAKAAAIRATVRIQAFRETQPDDHRRQVAHGYVSAPEGSVRTWREYFDGYAKAAELAKEKGMRGFSVIGHPWRLTEEAKELYREETGAEPEIGAWVWARNEYPGPVHELTYWSPHYHVIGATSPDMEPGGAEEGEWFWQFKRSVDRYELTEEPSYRDLYGLFRYLLSHTGFPEGSTKQVTRWYGEMSYSTFGDAEKPDAGTMATIERMAEKAAEPEREGEGESDDDVERCGCEGCEGLLIDVLDVPDYLMQAEPPPEVRERMQLAYDWRMGRVVPPPGLKHPKSREHAREAFEAML